MHQLISINITTNIHLSNIDHYWDRYYIICLNTSVIKGYLNSYLVLHTLMMQKKVIGIRELITAKSHSLRVVIIILANSKPYYALLIISLSYKNKIKI